MQEREKQLFDRETALLQKKEKFKKYKKDKSDQRLHQRKNFYGERVKMDSMRNDVQLLVDKRDELIRTIETLEEKKNQITITMARPQPPSNTNNDIKKDKDNGYILIESNESESSSKTPKSEKPIVVRKTTRANPRVLSSSSSSRISSYSSSTSSKRSTGSNGRIGRLKKKRVFKSSTSESSTPSSRGKSILRDRTNKPIPRQLTSKIVLRKRKVSTSSSDTSSSDMELTACVSPNLKNFYNATDSDIWSDTSEDDKHMIKGRDNLEKRQQAALMNERMQMEAKKRAKLAEQQKIVHRRNATRDKIIQQKMQKNSKRKLDNISHVDPPLKRVKPDHSYINPNNLKTPSKKPRPDSELMPPPDSTPHKRIKKPAKNYNSMPPQIDISKSPSPQKHAPMLWGKKMKSADDYFWDDNGEKTQISDDELLPWAKKENLYQILMLQKEIDPKQIFYIDDTISTINLGKVFGKDFPRSSESSEWSSLR
eukprot:TRINITY_DN9403_c0_g1_i1.p1 TRINITY_DN9403_c0_g1~~TRINITY_DN9403_c0_g1_i1.p1  ORF type:complete len:518 (+),score=119.33 TRINITY_DN9403_c0_g1_i1:109-1554(+)